MRQNLIICGRCKKVHNVGSKKFNFCKEKILKQLSGRKIHSGTIILKCQDYAYQLSKQKGLNYQQATKLFPMGYKRNSVYINNNEILEGHCVHCARADALLKYKN